MTSGEDDDEDDVETSMAMIVAGLGGALFVSTGVRKTWSSSSVAESSASETIPSSVSSLSER